LDGGSACLKAATSTSRTTQRQIKCIQTPMPQVVFERKIAVFEWAKIIHALDPAATVIGVIEPRIL
jgi:hypothetical protein